MHIVNGVAVVDREKCTSCMACASACPKEIIQKVPYEQRVLVGCRSNDKGAQTRKLCDAGCIGCMKCQRECPHEAIKVVNNLADHRLRQVHRLRPLRRGLPEAHHPPAEDIRPGQLSPAARPRGSGASFIGKSGNVTGFAGLIGRGWCIITIE